MPTSVHSRAETPRFPQPDAPSVAVADALPTYRAHNRREEIPQPCSKHSRRTIGSIAEHGGCLVADPLQEWCCPADARVRNELAPSSPRALTQIGHTSSSPPPSAYCWKSRSSGGQPSHASPFASPGSATRTASFVRNINPCLPCSTAATPTRSAIITRSASSSIPVARLTTTFPDTSCSLHFDDVVREVGGDGPPIGERAPRVSSRRRREHEAEMRPIWDDQPPAAGPQEPNDGTPVPRTDAQELDLKAVVRDVRVGPRRVSGNRPDNVVPVLLRRNCDQSKPVVARDDPVRAKRHCAAEHAALTFQRRPKCVPSHSPPEQRPR